MTETSTTVSPTVDRELPQVEAMTTFDAADRDPHTWADTKDLDRAVKGAWRAFDDWKWLSARERAAILLEIAQRIDQNAERLGMVETFPDFGGNHLVTFQNSIPLHLAVLVSRPT